MRRGLAFALLAAGLAAGLARADEAPLDALRGRPDLHYLEVGSRDAAALRAMLDGVLTHPTSRALVAGVSEEGAERLRAALREGERDRVEVRPGPSSASLRGLPADHYDVVRIFAAHRANLVLADAIRAWDALRLGGLLVFEDAGWTAEPGGAVRPLALRPKLAIDAFVTSHAAEIEELHSDETRVLRRRADPCAGRLDCTPLGPYVYQWDSRTLHRREGGEAVALDPAERRVVERIAQGQRFGQTRFDAGPALRGLPGYDAAVQRLGLDAALGLPTRAGP